MNVKVSLIIPVYNVEKYLEKCLESAINQTLKEIEIIIINDGSTDNSLEICKKYEMKDNRVKVFTQKNSGQGYARNFAIKNAKGEFIFCLDADDWIELNTLKLLYRTSQNESSDVVICGWQRIDEKNGNILDTRKDIHMLKKYDKDSINRHVFSAKMNLMACACLIKKSIIDDNYIIYPNIFHEDLYVMPKVYFYANKISIIKDNLYNWLVRSNSTTNSFSMKHAIGLGGVANDWKIFLLKENNFEIYKKEFIQGIITYLNLYIHRTHSFALNEEKDKLFEYLTDILIGIHELRDYKKVLTPKELETRRLILEFYDNILENSRYNLNSNQLTKQNSSLKAQLVEIKSSRGYKFLLKFYKFRDTFLPLGSKRRKILKFVADKIIKKDVSVYKKSDNNIKPIQDNVKKFDVVFLPHKDYQVWTMGLIARELKKLGLSSCLMDLTEHYKDEGSREAAKKFSDIEFKDLSYLLDGKISYNAIVCMNDWDKKVTRPLVLEAQKNNKKTIGIIEGINDFYDSDIKWERHAYQTVEYLLMTGEHDRQFFKAKKDKAYVVGIPRLQELMQEPVKFPKKPLAVINVNFSYGVLEDKRDFWLQSVLEGCRKANIDYVITQHPADKADLSKYNVSSKNMYDTIRDGSIIISRFGSIILESVAMGKPSIYHNPHNEKVVKFQEPIGAYSLSFDSNSLAEAINFELSLDIDYRERANKFLDFHCNINSKKSSALLSAEKIRDIVRSK